MEFLFRRTSSSFTWKAEKNVSINLLKPSRPSNGISFPSQNLKKLAFWMMKIRLTVASNVIQSKHLFVCHLFRTTLLIRAPGRGAKWSTFGVVFSADLWIATFVRLEFTNNLFKGGWGYTIPCFSVVPKATNEVRLKGHPRRVPCRHVSPKSPSWVQDRDEGFAVRNGREHCFLDQGVTDHTQANQWFFSGPLIFDCLHPPWFTCLALQLWIKCLQVTLIVGAVITSLPYFALDRNSYDVGMSLFFTVANVCQQGFEPEPQRGNGWWQRSPKNIFLWLIFFHPKSWQILFSIQEEG